MEMSALCLPIRLLLVPLITGSGRLVGDLEIQWVICCPLSSPSWVILGFLKSTMYLICGALLLTRERVSITV
jgi:hypothetical protein